MCPAAFQGCCRRQPNSTSGLNFLSKTSNTLTFHPPPNHPHPLLSPTFCADSSAAQQKANHLLAVDNPQTKEPKGILSSRLYPLWDQTCRATTDVNTNYVSGHCELVNVAVALCLAPPPEQNDGDGVLSSLCLLLTISLRNTISNIPAASLSSLVSTFSL